MLTLTSLWDGDANPCIYSLTLTNHGNQPVADFTLAFSGAAMAIGPRTQIDGGTLRLHLSNHIELVPPAGFILAPGMSWQLVIRALPFPLRHWTDGAAGAYVILGDGRILDVEAVPANSVDGQASPRRGAVRYPLPETLSVALSIIPWPNAVETRGARVLPKGLALRPVTLEADRAASAFTEIVSLLFADEDIVSTADGALTVAFRDDVALGPEAYELVFEDTGAIVAASGQTGYLYGLVTLGQILRGARRHPDQFVVPQVGTIRDEPALGWRGSHLDVARQFYAPTEVSRFLAIMAWNKLNRLHWHLTDDEAWRIPIDAYPQLTEVGGWRGHGRAVPPLLGSGPMASGGAYGRDDIVEIVARAQELGIAVVPEIDIPGHCFALLQALPELRDPGETGTYQSVQGFPNNCLNPGHVGVQDFLEAVIDEVLALFPAGIFHLGADEVPLGAWSGSPEALRRLEEIAGTDTAARHRARANMVSGLEEADAIEGSGTAMLQADFIRRVHDYLLAKGAITGGWQEAAHGEVLDKSRSYLVGWRDREISAALAGDGYDIVVSPAQRYYLDMALGPDWAEPGAGWAGSSSTEETYMFEPREGWNAQQLSHLLGVQACIWSERMADRAVFDRLVFPRLSAIAETGWTRPEHKSWARFSALASLMPLLYGNWDKD